MPRLRKVSGETVVRVLCNRFEFTISGRSGSHVRLSRMTSKGKVGTVVPMHKELKIGTLKGILKLASVNIDEFAKYL
ncbi:MAG: type II toxin-antitoxin system HicA family toxin [Theionarchaea archaeon]|nr:type II toxin-antitoxin system HicA family toxin [Theionarchaea archaeon]